MSDFKPCPFCNRAHGIYMDSFRQEPREWEVYCGHPDCEATGPTRSTLDDATAAWNTRSPAPDASDEDVLLAVGVCWQLLMPGAALEAPADIGERFRAALSARGLRVVKS